VARVRIFRRTGALGVALTAWDIWRRIPKQHRRMIVRQARRQGPKVAAAVITYGRRRSGRKPPG
jgi:hypothetical protein